MKRFYSETIPYDLGIKLQDAGMSIEWEDNTPDEWHECPNVHCLTMYGEVLDWLMEKGYDVTISRKFTNHNEWWSDVFRIVAKDSFAIQSKKNYREYLYTLDWFEAANAGIETALKILKEEKK